MIYQVKIEKMDVHAYIIPSFPNGEGSFSGSREGSCMSG
jgi:hypothetical protein